MDFFTTNDGPIEITIDEKPVSLQRFLLPQLKAWSASIRKQVIDEATKHLDKEDRAKFLLYYTAPPIDTADLVLKATTPEGAEYIVNEAMKLAGVDEKVRQGVINASDPRMLAALADELTTATRTKTLLAKDGDTKDPLTSPPPAFGGSPEISPATTPVSDANIPEQIQAA